MDSRIVRIWSAGDQLSAFKSQRGLLDRIRAKSSVRTLEDIETDATQLVDVWVVDLGEEADLGRDHGVVIRQEQLKLELSAYTPRISIASRRESVASWGGGQRTLVRGPGWSMDLDVKVSQVIVVRDGTDARNSGYRKSDPLSETVYERRTRARILTAPSSTAPSP